MAAPFVWIFVCFSAGILLKSLFVFPWLLPITLLLGVLTVRFRGWRIAVISQSLLLILLGQQISSYQQKMYEENPLRHRVIFEDREPLLLRGVIIRTPEVREDFCVLYLKVESAGVQNHRGVVRVTVAGIPDPLPVIGDKVETFARIRLPSNFATEGCFDYERYLKKEGVHAVGSINHPQLVHIIERGHGWRTWISRFRLNLIHEISGSFSQDIAALFRALWLDDRSGLTRKQEQSLVDAGIFHVIAISGFHIAIVLALGFFLLKHLVRYKPALIILGILLLFYFFLLEGRSSVSRAFIAFGILFLAAFLKESPSWPNVLALSAFLQLALNPLELYDSGFHLTYLSTAIILFVVRPVCKFVKLPRVAYQYCFNFLVTSFLVQAMLVPYQAFVFHRIPFGSIAANLFALPFSSALIASAPFWLVFRNSFANVSFVFQKIATWFLDSSLFISGLWLRFVTLPPLWIVMAFYISVVCALFVKRVSLRIFCTIIAAVSMVFSLFPEKLPAPNFLRLHFLDVGQGDAVLIEYPDGSYDLVDAGGFWNPEALDTGESIVLPYLASIGVRELNRVFLTHAHADHMNGLISVMKYVPVKRFFVSVTPYGDPGFRSFVNQINRKPELLSARDHFYQGGVRMGVISPHLPVSLRRVSNDDSLVLILEYEGKRILLTGDIERKAEESIAALDLDPVDFLKVAHHGSKNSSTEELLGRINAKTAIISAGRGNWFGHPHADTLARLRKHKMLVYRTDQQGTIRISIGRDWIQMDAYQWNQW